MSDLKTGKMPKMYAVIWGVIAAVYAVWMIFFMKDIVLINYESVAERTVDGFIQANITGMMGQHWLYPVWTIFSIGSILMYIVYIKKVLYAEELTSLLKWACLFSAVFGCVYIVWYGFFDVTKSDGTPAVFADKVKYITASMIGLEYPWHFRGWGIFGCSSVFINTMYTFRKYNYDSKLGVILGSIGSAAIYMTINCPSVGEGKDFSHPRCLAHWAGALLFAVCCAAPLVIFLFNKARKEKGAFLTAFVIFAAVLAVMLVLLITVGKSAIIENIPMIAAYVLLLLLNYTNVFKCVPRNA